MGLTKTSFGITDSEVTIYSGKTGTIVNNTAADRETFVANISTWDESSSRTLGLYRSSRVKLITDSSGVKNLKIKLKGWTYRGGIADGTWTGPVQWKVSTSLSRQGGTWYNIAVTKEYVENIESGTVEVNLLPNTTYYLWIQYGDNKCWGWGRLGLDVTPSGVYGEAGDITAADGTFGSAVSISYASPTSGATYTVKTSVAVESGGNNGTTLYEETLQTKSSTSSRNWTPALATYGPKITGKQNTTCTITVQTYFGDALAGTKQKTITLYFAAADVAPTLAYGCFSCLPLNGSAAQYMTGYIQNYSKVRGSYGSSKVTLKQSATVKEWRVRFGNTAEQIVPASTSSKDSDIITGDLTVTFTLVDSRGLTAQQTVDITTYPYNSPSFDSEGTLYYRCAAGSDSPSDTGTRLALYPKVNFSSVGGQNTLRNWVFKWKYSSATNYTDMTSAASPSLGNEVKSFFANFEDHNYDLWLTVEDRLGNTAEWKRSVPSSKHFLTSTTGWDGAAFGRVAEYADTLDIGSWDLRCGNVVINGEDLGALLAQIKAALNIS